MRRYRWFGGIAGLVLAAGIAAFFGRTRLFPRQLERVTFGTAPSVNASLVYIALAEGLFAQEGLEFVIQDYQSSQQAFWDVCDERLDLAAVAETPVALARFQRDDFRVLASLFSAYNDPKVLARKSHGVTVPADLRGKRVGTTALGQSAHYFLDLFLVKYGLTEADLTLQFQSPAELKLGLARGQLDAIALFEPHLAEIAPQLGDDAVLFSEPQLYVKRLLLMSHARLTTERPGAIRKLLRALTGAERFTAEQPELAARIVAVRLGREPAIVQHAWREAAIGVALEQSLLLLLEQEAAWMLANHTVETQERPNFLDTLYLPGLTEVAPDAVTVYQ